MSGARYEQFTAFLSATEKMLDKGKRTMRSDLERAAQSFEADSKSLADNFAQNAPTSCAALKTDAALHQLSVFEAQLQANRKAQVLCRSCVFDALPPSILNHGRSGMEKQPGQKRSMGGKEMTDCVSRSRSRTE